MPNPAAGSTPYPRSGRHYVRTHVTDASKLAEESARATEVLAGKVVARVVRHREGEVLVEFEDGTRLFVDRTASGVELSITGARRELIRSCRAERPFGFLARGF
jgi:hypothetical protein